MIVQLWIESRSPPAKEVHHDGQGETEMDSQVTSRCYAPQPLEWRPPVILLEPAPEPAHPGLLRWPGTHDPARSDSFTLTTGGDPPPNESTCSASRRAFPGAGLAPRPTTPPVSRRLRSRDSWVECPSSRI